MPITPYAQLFASINGGALQSGGITSVPASATVQLSPGSTVGWRTSATVYQITAFPPGWPAPTGWTYDSVNQLYYYYANGSNGTNPPPLTMPSSAQISSGIWGKWKFRLLVNGGGGQLTDWTLALEIDSSTNLKDIAVAEGTEFGGPLKWVYALQQSLRVIDAAIRGGVGGGVSLGSGTPSTNSAAAGSQGALATAAPFDHSHQVVVASPVTIGTAIAEGTSTSLARADHVHSLGWATVTSVFGAATSSLPMNGQKITGLGTPTVSTDAVTKAYADVFGTFTSVAAALAAATAPIDVGGQRITDLGTPTAASDAVTKAYVDASVGADSWKVAVRGASLGNQPLSGALTEDGIVYNLDDRYLAKDQTDPTQNGIYSVNTAGAWTRATDASTSSQLGPGCVVVVSEGTANGGTGWELTTPAPISLGSTGLTFTKVFEALATAATANTSAARGANAEAAFGYVYSAGTVAASGFVRLPSSSTAVAFRNAGGTADVAALALDGANGLSLGDGTNGTGYVTVNVHGSGLLVKDNGTEVFAVDSAGAQVRHGLAQILWGASVVAPSLTQAQLAGTGAAAGQQLTITGQAGQAQTGTANNNNGGEIALVGGAAGTGGSGSAGTQGAVYMQGAGVDLLLGSVGLQWGTSVSNPTFTQSSLPGTGTNNGQNFTLQAQAGQNQTGVANNNNGGTLAIEGGAAGTGGSGTAGAQGNVTMQGGGNTATVSVLGLLLPMAVNYQPIAAPSVPASGWDVFSDSGDANRLKWMSTSTVTLALGAAALSWGSAVAAPTFGQDQLAGTGAANGQNLTVQPQAGQNQAGATNNNSGGTLSLLGGAAGTGGSGSAGSQGLVYLQGGGTDLILNNGFFWGNDVTAPFFGQKQAAGTGTNAGYGFTVQAQQGQAQTGAVANNNGGNLVLAGGAAGTGGSGAAGVQGNVLLEGGGFTATLSPAGFALPFATNYQPVTAPSAPASGWDVYSNSGASNRMEWLSTTAVQLALGAASLTFGPSVSAPTFGQDQLSGTGANAGQALLIQAQQGQAQSGVNNNNVGGNLTLAAGAAGTGGSGLAGSQGNLYLKGASYTVAVTAAGWSFDGPLMEFASSVTNPLITQAQLPGNGAGAGQPLLIQAQQGQAVASGTNNNGGNLTLQAGAVGTGGTGGAAGNVLLKSGALTATVSGSGVDLDRGNLTTVRSVEFDPSTNGSILIPQESGTGSLIGSNLYISAQQGQNQTGANNNTYGGNVVISAGAAGTGGSGSPGVPGLIEIDAGNTQLNISSTNISLAVDAGATATLGTAGWTKNPTTTAPTTDATPTSVYSFSLTTTHDAFLDITVRARITSGANSGKSFTMRRSALVENPSGTPVLSTGTLSPANGVIFSCDETGGALSASCQTLTFSANTVQVTVTGIAATTIDWALWIDVLDMIE